MEQRIIKFKAKSLGSGKWVEGDLLHRVTDTCIAVKDMDDILYCPVDPSTVCQYTGVTDKFNKGIYIGDIIEVPVESGEPYTEKLEVIFVEGILQVLFDGESGTYTLEDVKDCFDLEFKGVVIGSKFDKEGKV